MRQTRDRGTRQRGRRAGEAARKRAAVEIVADHAAELKRTARRFSLDPEDAEDAYQRALEILLVKAPTTDRRELVRWTQTVVRHEAMALRESRERLLARHPPGGGDRPRAEPLTRIAARADGPAEQAQRREAVARGREALRALRPAELRTLTLLAEGYSYAEIGARTGFSPTKVNKTLASGRERFRAVFAGSEDGSRCRELRPLLSAFCDGEASGAEQRTVREHLRACASCRATMRAYRAAPLEALALAPATALLPWRSLLDRLHEAVSSLGAKASALKLAAAGTVTAGGAAIVVGVVPAPVDLGGGGERPAVVREAARPPAPPVAADAQAPQRSPRRPRRDRRRVAKQPESAPQAVAAPEPVEYEAPPAEAPPPAPEPQAPAPAPEPSASAGSAAGEFGP